METGDDKRWPITRIVPYGINVLLYTCWNLLLQILAEGKAHIEKFHRLLRFPFRVKAFSRQIEKKKKRTSSSLVVTPGP